MSTRQNPRYLALKQAINSCDEDQIMMTYTY